MADETPAASPAPSGGGSKLVVIVSIVNMIATIGVVAVLMLSHQKESSKPTVEDIVNGEKAKGHGGGGGHGDAAKSEHGGGGGHGGGHGGGAAVEAPVSDAGKIATLEPFTVNLSSGVGTSPRYVRMNVSIELEQGVSEKEFEVKMPRVRDTVINLLNSKKASELNTAEGREQLKEEIKRNVNNYMLQSKVKGVYFTNFAISN